MLVGDINILNDIVNGKIKVDRIEINITPSEEHPIGMPMAKFKAFAGANGKPITHKTINEWINSGRIKVEKMSRNHTYVVQFGNKKWDGERFS